MSVTTRLTLIGLLLLAACDGATPVADTTTVPAAPVGPPEAASSSGAVLQSPALGPEVGPGGLPAGARGDPANPAASGSGPFYGTGDRNFYGYN